MLPPLTTAEYFVEFFFFFFSILKIKSALYLLPAFLTKLTLYNFPGID